MEKTYLLTKEQFTTFKKAWSDSQLTHTAQDHIIYNLLSSKPLDNGFCEKKKIGIYEDSWYAFKEAKRNARVKLTFAMKKETKIFGLEISEAMIELLK